MDTSSAPTPKPTTIRARSPRRPKPLTVPTVRLRGRSAPRSTTCVASAVAPLLARRARCDAHSLSAPGPRLRCSLPVASLGVQPVAETPNRHHHPGRARVPLDLGPQPADVDVDDPLVAEETVLPDPLEQLLPAEHPAGRGGQLAQQPELGE